MDDLHDDVAHSAQPRLHETAQPQGENKGQTSLQRSVGRSLRLLCSDSCARGKLLCVGRGVSCAIIDVVSTWLFIATPREDNRRPSSLPHLLPLSAPQLTPTSSSTHSPSSLHTNNGTSPPLPRACALSICTISIIPRSPADHVPHRMTIPRTTTCTTTASWTLIPLLSRLCTLPRRHQRPPRHTSSSPIQWPV
jgi:hypothetical protein